LQPANDLPHIAGCFGEGRCLGPLAASDAARIDRRSPVSGGGDAAGQIIEIGGAAAQRGQQYNQRAFAPQKDLDRHWPLGRIGITHQLGGCLHRPGHLRARLQSLRHQRRRPKAAKRCSA
jgi:hypothetical protein